MANKEKWEKLYQEYFEEYLEMGYFEDEADQMATRDAGIECGYGPTDLFL